MSDLIQPKVLKGFRDFLPADEIERDLLMERLVKVFRDYGFIEKERRGDRKAGFPV